MLSDQKSNVTGEEPAPAVAAGGGGGGGENSGNAAAAEPNVLATTATEVAEEVTGVLGAAAAASLSSLAGDDAATDAGLSSLPPSETGARPPLDNVVGESGGLGGMVGPPSPLTGCYLLIILGEPHSEEHKHTILQHLLKGKRT